MNRIKQAILSAVAVGATLGAHAQPTELTEIKVSYQPALYWALPFFVATEKNWWAEVGLRPVFSVFPAGVPQMAAAASKSWDVGATGSVPAVLGFLRFGIRTVGLSNDESGTNALMASQAAAQQFVKNPASIKGQTILVTSNSTGDFAVQACLRKYGLSKSDVSIRNMGQAEIISALSSGGGALAGLWAPNTYQVEEKAGAVQLCSGKDGGVIVPGALVARGDYAQQNPENVAKFLAVYLRAWSWMHANRGEAIAMMRRFYEQGGTQVDDVSLQKEFATRPTFRLDQQLARMDRSRGDSEMDGWFSQIAHFMRGTGAIQNAPASNAYITEVYMKRVNADPKLREFANRTN
ncbi:nitrate ABC transporter substrate-binding protein [Verminephrobacter aporrectodeae subsp. tuberculatae]|uniref:ABC transporter substrate-binding protein n=1 Tax=Verminephrobacter aporrectodeae TaxID=1110389 RepID=UPI0022388980|nr:ABC transporter substrate-binding protein [Verminephrobacter aporrectodeae]MCW5256597.1 nitrate ABC transporter substrate-binding protein [Verminephrobacter aporrectodeae subsp. tuberculatae]MCW8199513.1 nitrate ABC transporter substrate-binding protein [Verminephrobacter aporrectodeae subsp. tuberculatae]